MKPIIRILFSAAVLATAVAAAEQPQSPVATASRIAFREAQIRVLEAELNKAYLQMDGGSGAQWRQWQDAEAAAKKQMQAAMDDLKQHGCPPGSALNAAKLPEFVCSTESEPAKETPPNVIPRGVN